ncbi:MAG: polynucleotide kinase-phosphatase [Thermoanaerobaculia bacterium]
MKIAVPELSLIVLIGPSGCGKSTFAAKHFRPTEVLSSDRFRALVSDDEMDQTATRDAFEVLHHLAAKRLARGRLTVIDATNTQPAARKPLVELAKDAYLQAAAVVFDLPPRLCEERNRGRTDRQVPPHVVFQQRSQLERSLRDLQREGFRRVFVLRSPEEIEAVAIERERLWPDRRDDPGPFDIIGDVHGCANELEELLARLGYSEGRHPEGRKLVFLGDLVDRGPRVPDVLRIAMDMVKARTALCVPGNHDDKLKRYLQGKKVRIAHGLEQSIEQIEDHPAAFRERALAFLDGLVSHYVLDGGRLVVAHAGMKAEMQGRASGRVREFALYGETTGESDEFGLPVRYNWAADYRGAAMVVYGHTPVHRPEWLNNTINIDTGCVFGGELTALRYPELELVSVPARRTYRESKRPFKVSPELTAQQRQDELLDLDDVMGKRIVSTRLRGDVTIREENATAALEVMSRFAADPRWLLYLPPTMSPSETADPETQPGWLEHPAQAFAHYRRERIAKVVCQEKHMGSRAVLVVCRDEDAARRRIGVTGDGFGICLTRTGRCFFEGKDRDMEAPFLALVRDAVDRAGRGEELATDWICLDAELMPWSAKAQELIRDQYAAAGAAARGALPEAVAVLEQGAARGLDFGGGGGLPDRFRTRRDLAARYEAAYRRYSWPISSVADLRLAPVHLLASEGAVHVDKDHLWHMATLARLGLTPTPYRIVDLADPESEAEAVRWWMEMTEAGGEGMVIKPLDFLAEGRKGLAQSALKCRGREYLRIIYGPEYDLPENLQRLRSRGLAAKRSLALRELALGVEALERFVAGEPLRRVHECVFGILALESEPVDPRL